MLFSNYLFGQDSDFIPTIDISKKKVCLIQNDSTKKCYDVVDDKYVLIEGEKFFVYSFSRPTLKYKDQGEKGYIEENQEFPYGASETIPVVTVGAVKISKEGILEDCFILDKGAASYQVKTYQLMEGMLKWNPARYEDNAVGCIHIMSVIYKPY